MVRAGLLTELHHELPTFVPPAAVELLSGIWPGVSLTLAPQTAAEQLLQQHARGCAPRLTRSSTPMRLSAYAHDEVARIERLVGANEDHRSALLRAAGLDELLLKARWLRIWRRGWVDIWDGDGRRYLGHPAALNPAGQKVAIYAALLDHQGTDLMRWALQQAWPNAHQSGQRSAPFLKIETGRGINRAVFGLRPAAEAPILQDYARGAGLSGETLTDLRNQAIHMYLGATRAIAEAAVRLVRANLADYQAHWTPLSRAPAAPPDPAGMRCLPWDELCRLCGLEHLPLTDKEKA